jgi:hypothetical protein
MIPTQPAVPQQQMRIVTNPILGCTNNVDTSEYAIHRNLIVAHDGATAYQTTDHDHQQENRTPMSATLRPESIRDHCTSAISSPSIPSMPSL